MRVSAAARHLACLSAVAAFGCAAAAPSDAPPRHLVYSYTFESARSDESDRAPGLNKMDPGGGGTFYFHNVNQHYIAPAALGDDSNKRSGTLAIDVVREQADGGLVLRIEENPASGSSVAVTCVTFADTTVVCDPNQPFGPEVPQIAALLGKGFVDPGRFDAAKHWRIAPPGAYGTTADYTVVSANGAMLEIEESAVASEDGSPSKTTIDAKIEYDFSRSLPTAVDETTVRRTEHGVVDETLSTHATFELQPPPG